MNAHIKLTTHVLDTSRGCPAGGIAVQVEALDGQGRWRQIGQGVTDADGRISNLINAGPMEIGRYRLIFETQAYFASLAIATFYPKVTVEFETSTLDEHYHVPLLLSPFGYTTYRGS